MSVLPEKYTWDNFLHVDVDLRKLRVFFLEDGE